MSIWVNRTILSGTSVNANGTTSHTCTFTAATAGNLLVAVIAGGVTSTTPTGWSLLASAISDAGLYVFTKTASSGESSFTTTHNGSNFPIQGIVYEFASSLSVAGTAGTSITNPTTGSTVGPSATSLGGVYTRFAVRAVNLSTNATPSGSCTWTTPTVEDLDTTIAGNGSTTDGVGLAIAYNDACGGSSFTPVSTYSASAGSSTASSDISFAITSAATVPTPLFIQSNSYYNVANDITVAQAYNYQVVTGDLLVVALSYLNSSVTPTGITDTLGNTYSIAGSAQVNASIPATDYIYYCVSAASGTNTVTISFPSNVNFRRMAIHAYENVNALDVAAGATGASGATIDSGPMATSHATELIFGWGVSNNGVTAADTGSGFTLRVTAGSESTEDKIVTSTSTYDATFPSAGGAWVCQGAAFYYNNGGGGNAVIAWLTV